jgi:hypothetical protein
MATEEEVDITIRALADTRQMQELADALQRVRDQARQTQDGVGQVAAAGGAPSGTASQAAAAGAQRAAQATQQLKKDTDEATAATRNLGAAFALSNQNLIRFVGSLAGVGIGLSLYAAAGRLLHEVAQRFIVDQIDLEHAQRANTVTLGQQAASYQDWARTVSEQAGFTQRTLLEAGTAAGRFAQQVGLDPSQVQNLVGLSTVLARLQGNADVAQTMNQLASAIQGNAGAAQQLNLQLDAAYVAYTQLGPVTSEVFNNLDASTQASLRFAAAQEQIAQQAAAPVTPVDELAKTVGNFNVAIEKLAQAEGPGFLKALTDIVSGAGAAVGKFRELDDKVVELSRHFQDLQNAEKDFFKDRAQPITDVTDTLRRNNQEALDFYTQRAAAAKQLEQQGITPANTLDYEDQLRDAQAVQAAQAETARQEATAFQGLGAAARDARDDATRARAEQFAAVREQLQGPLETLAAARQNEIAATTELVSLRQQTVDLTAQEAAIRLGMLPAQQEMAQLQNQVNQAQIEATQRALPATRALQDLQNQIREQQLIAENVLTPPEERAAARRRAIALGRTLETAELGAQRAQVAELPAQRAAQDVGYAAALQQLQQQALLLPHQFAQQSLELLGQIATAAAQAAQRTIEVTIQEIRVDLGAAHISEDDTGAIANLVGQQVAESIHQARLAAERSANPQLAGAGS